MSYDVEETETKRREVDALLRASKALKCNNLTVITWDYEGVETHGDRRIKFIPLWRWLLG
ncbi:hypothetical protein [Pyrococcus abyssi]|uniref:ATP-binding protein n=1 Tax=Pyrococcus abyssi (strain GE5 / Orsay) TaxID=272844 RepID=G8ZGA5_PYRAB|nr:hypothetical protein [Pyrococcus abyssi]CCE69784.1 TPA: hypothetical protein PAB2078.1n [Pyrococcus abyssi GE5]